MIVQCSQCSKTLKVPDIAAGKRVRCPACSGVVEVPLVASAQSPSIAGATSQNAVAGGRGDAAKGEGLKSPSLKDVPTSSNVIRRARVISSESRGSGDSSTASEGSTEGGSATTPTAKEASSRGKGGRIDGVRDSLRSDRGSSVKSSSSGKPRKRATPAEQGEDVEDYDSGYGSYEDDGADYFESNPFAPPKAGSASSSGRSGGPSDIASRKLAGLGLLIQGWATVSIFLLVVFIFVASVIAAAMERGGGAGSPGLLVLIGLAAIAMFIGAIVVLVGECICLASPQRSGAKGLIIAAIGCLAVQVLFSVIQALADQGTSSLFRPAPFRQGPSSGQLMFAMLGLVSGLGHLICFELFLRKASENVRRDDLARQAMMVLIGIPSCFVLIFVCSFSAPLLARFVAPVMGLVMLAPILAAGIAIIVFSVMHVSLLFRVGWALRG